MAPKRKVSLTRPTREAPVTIYTRNGEGKSNAVGRSTPLLYPPSIEGDKRGPPPDTGGIEEVRELVRKLSDADRKQLLTELALAEQSKSAPSRDLDMWATAVQTALHAANSSGAGGGVGLIPLRRLLGARAAWAPVEAFMHTAGLDALTVTERNAAYGVLAELLVEHAQIVARHVGIPLTGKFVCNCVGDIAAVFNQAFPGYAAGGMAPLVLRGRSA